MKYILILVLSNSTGSAVETQEFNSMQACQAAKNRTIEQHSYRSKGSVFTNLKASCLSKEVA